MFLLNILFLYIEKYVKSLNRICCGFYFLMYAKTNLYIHIYEKVDKINFLKLMIIFKISKLK